MSRIATLVALLILVSAAYTVALRASVVERGIAGNPWWDDPRVCERGECDHLTVPSACEAVTVGDRTIGCGQIAFQGKGPERWASEYRKLALRYLAAERRLVELRQMVPYRRAVPYAVRLASVVYGVPERQLNTVMECESGGWPLARNPSSTASGLMQFLDSTWSGSWGAKKFADAGFSVFDPIASMLAAAYVVSRDGSWRQWACAP